MTTKIIGLLGYGTIGSEVYKLYRRNKGYYSELIGSSIEITRVAVRDVAKHEACLSGAPFTTDIESVVCDPNIDLVIALLGDPDEEYRAISVALENGKQVVTANKKALAHHWQELTPYIYPFGGRLLFEAAVCAGIQITDNVLNRYLSNRFTCCEGIVNGTTNYIFTLMREQGISFRAALREAQKLGYAEPDPIDDIESLLKFGTEDNLMIGTDYSHTDISANLSALDEVRGWAEQGLISQTQAKKILETNSRSFYGL